MPRKKATTPRKSPAARLVASADILVTTEPRYGARRGGRPLEVAFGFSDDGEPCALVFVGRSHTPVVLTREVCAAIAAQGWHQATAAESAALDAHEAALDAGLPPDAADDAGDAAYHAALTAAN
jgi:hypothetical protein